MGRREKGGVVEYEVKWWDRAEKHNLHIDKERLERTGHAEEVLKYDMLVAARAAGLDLINVTVKELQAHLDEFGLTAGVRYVREGDEVYLGSKSEVGPSGGDVE